MMPVAGTDFVMLAYALSLVWYQVWGLAALYLLMTIGMWGSTLRTLGFSSLARGPRMLRLSLRAFSIRELSLAVLLPCIAIVLVKKFEIGGRYLQALPLNAVLLIGLLCFTLVLMPPVALVLSSSTNEQLRWALSLKKFVGGRRVISLLDTGVMAPKLNVSDVWSIMLKRSSAVTDVLRVSNTRDWQTSVRELIDISPIVVVDTTVCTPAVLFEAAVMLTSEHLYKAIFVTENDGASPVLERLWDEGSVSCECFMTVAKKEELGRLLEKLVASRDTLPKPGSFACAREPGSPCRRRSA